MKKYLNICHINCPATKSGSLLISLPSFIVYYKLVGVRTYDL